MLAFLPPLKWDQQRWAAPVGGAAWLSVCDSQRPPLPCGTPSDAGEWGGGWARLAPRDPQGLATAC